MINIKERGSAEIIVSLKDSIITMRHGDTKEVLFEGKARHGDWKKIIHSITRINSEYYRRTENEA